MLEDLTFDQIYLMACDKDELKKMGTRLLTVTEAAAMGLIPESEAFAESLASRLNREQREEEERVRKMTPRQRRRYERQKAKEKPKEE